MPNIMDSLNQNVPIVGQPFEILQGTATVAIKCKARGVCAQEGTLLLIHTRQPAQCGKCGALYICGIYQEDPQGNVRAGINVRFPDQPAQGS